MKLFNTAEYFYESVFIFSSLVFACTVVMVILHLSVLFENKEFALVITQSIINHP